MRNCCGNRRALHYFCASLNQKGLFLKTLRITGMDVHAGVRHCVPAWNTSGPLLPLLLSLAFTPPSHELTLLT